MTGAATTTTGAAAAPAKVCIYIDDTHTGASHRICWYGGTSDAHVAQAVRLQLQLPINAAFLLRDRDGDLVPISSVLPSNHRFALVRNEDVATAIVLAHTAAAPDASANASLESIDTPLHVTSPQAAVAATLALAQSSRLVAKPALPLLAPTPISNHLRVRAGTVAHIVTLFLSVFTAPIENDDNISFIPSTGKFALYALYTALVHDRALHPKAEHAFYKMTSLHGKVDRQRVMRYYRDASTALNDTHVLVVPYKPQGKGPLLRKYAATHDVERDNNASLVGRIRRIAPLLQLSPERVLATYSAFVRGFQPVSKATYHLHHRRAGALGTDVRTVEEEGVGVIVNE